MSRLFGLIVAAGSGSRFSSEVPKQYQPLGNRLVLDVSVAALQQLPLTATVVVLSAGDTRWHSSRSAADPSIQTVTGGVTRADSVLAGLSALLAQQAGEDWVLVHDAARPLLQAESVARLVESVASTECCGGILAVPVTDTLKRVETDAPALPRISATVPRERIWRAQTPQMFRVGQLHQALSDALRRAEPVTDEASAMELSGFAPLIIEGRPDNLKITHPEDLALAEWLLSRQTRRAT